MARWQLMQPHYLNCVGDHAAEWEYKEQDKATKRQKKVKFPVPTHLDPLDPSCWNYRDNFGDGQIIVSLEGYKADPNDIVFRGTPTPDMRPLDDEAKTLSAEAEKRWGIAPRVTDEAYGDTLADKFVEELTRLRVERDVKPTAGVPMEGMTELLATMAKVMEQNQQLIAALVGNASARAINPEAQIADALSNGGRRV